VALRDGHNLHGRRPHSRKDRVVLYCSLDPGLSSRLASICRWFQWVRLRTSPCEDEYQHVRYGQLLVHGGAVYDSLDEVETEWRSSRRTHRCAHEVAPKRIFVPIRNYIDQTPLNSGY
jgi:hypothetical protein